jgi:hypothetical protein
MIWRNPESKKPEAGMDENKKTFWILYSGF